MTLLEFLLVLISVVIGLGLAAILSGATRLLRRRADVRFYWLHSLFQVGVFLALIQQWWETWELQGMGTVSFAAVLTLLGSPVILYVMADLLFPDEVEDADLRAYYYDQAALLWGLALMGTVVGTLLRPLALGYELFALANVSGIPTALVCAALIATRDARVHSVLAPAMVVILVLDTLLAASAISAG